VGKRKAKFGYHAIKALLLFLETFSPLKAFYPMGTGGGISTPRLKLPGLDADYKPQFSSESMNRGAIPSFSHMPSWHSA
jgi:hypothetical protein